MTTSLKLAGLLLAAALLQAGDGHDHGALPGADAGTGGNWLELSTAARHNLDLRTAPVETRPIHRTLAAIGTLEPAPGRSTEITSRIEGQIHSLEGAVGRDVTLGQELLRILSGQPGDPPPVITVKAPRSGIVTRLHVNPGSRVSPDEHLLDVVDPGVLHARATIHEGQIRRLRLGQQARIRPAAWPDSIWTGTLVRIGGELDPETGTLPAWFEVPNARARLKPNMRTQLSILTEGQGQALVVPKAAVLGEHGQRFVFVERDGDHGVYERVEVALGLEDDLGLQVLSGLDPGERVVVQGNYQLQYLPGQAEPPAGLVEHDHDHDHALDHDHDHDGIPDHGPGEDSAHEQAAPDEHGHAHGEEDHAHGEEDHDADHDHGPLRLFQIALGLSLLGNLVLLLGRDRRLRRVTSGTPRDGEGAQA